MLTSFAMSIDDQFPSVRTKKFKIQKITIIKNKKRKSYSSLFLTSIFRQKLQSFIRKTMKKRIFNNNNTKL